MQEQLWVTFKTVAETGSLSKAARRLNLSQSAVSQHIQQLEEEYQTQLLVRTAQGVLMTPAGELLYRYVNRILRTVEESRQALQALHTPDGARLTVGASLTIAEYVLPRVFTVIWRPSPRERLSVVMANSQTVFDQVLNRVVDVGLIEQDLVHPQLVNRPFYEDQLAVLVPRSHRWAAAGQAPLDEFLQEPLIVREPGSGTRRALEQALDQVGLGLDVANVRLVLGTTQAIKAMVASGMGVSVLSTLTVSAAEAELYAWVTVEDLSFRRRFYVVHQRDLPVPRARHLIEALTRWPDAR